MAHLAHHAETELKFELDARAATKIRSHSFLKKAASQTRAQRNVYFDSDNGDVHLNGYSLRVRQIGDRFMQTLKTSSRSVGLFDRQEWETPVSRMEPDLSALDQTPLANCKNLNRLKPVARSDVKRTSWTIDREGSAIEVVLDSCKLSAGGQEARFNELEIELKNGDAGALFALAHELAHAAPLEISVLSKGERCFMLARNLLGREQKASAVDIRSEMDVGQAIVTIVHECIRHFRMNEPAIIADRNPEALHQARVAIRRLRTAFSFFRPVIRQRALDPFRDELRSFIVPFGKARNLDVFLARHGKNLLPSDRRKLTTARGEAYDQVIEAMGKQQTRDMFLDLVEWAACRDWQKDGAATPIAKFASERLDSQWRKVRRKGSRLPDLDERQLHRLRIHAKKLRYSIEFMAGVYSGKEVGQFREILEQVQDCFGLLHDEIIARQLIEEFSLEFVASRRGSQQSRRLKEAKAHFKRLKQLGRVWSQ